MIYNHWVWSTQGNMISFLPLRGVLLFLFSSSWYIFQSIVSSGDVFMLEVDLQAIWVFRNMTGSEQGKSEGKTEWKVCIESRNTQRR